MSEHDPTAPHVLTCAVCGRPFPERSLGQGDPRREAPYCSQACAERAQAELGRPAGGDDGAPSDRVMPAIKDR